MRSFQRLAPLFLAGFTGLTIAFIPALTKPLLAQQTDPRAIIELTPNQNRTQSDRRVALVIGNSSYTTVSPLRNPANDARDMAQALEDLGFEKVIPLIDGNLEQMLAALENFKQELRQGSVGVFYYAGHGVQLEDKNYLIPVDANIDVPNLLKTRTLPLDDVLSYMGSAGNALNIVILDACRNNPFRSLGRSAEAGLASVNAPTGVLVAYATAPGSVAADGTGNNGTYTEALLKYIRTPGLKVEDFFKNVRVEVQRSTRNAQVPWEATSLVGDFAFNPTAASATAAPIVQPPVVRPTPVQPANVQPVTVQPAPTPSNPTSSNLETQYAQLAALTFQQGTTALNARNYASAIESFDRALGLDANNAEIYLSRATAYLALNRYDSAIADYEKAKQLNPALTSRIASDLARAYQQRGATISINSPTALADYTRAIELNPSDALAYYQRGTLYSKQNDYNAALRDFDRAIELADTPTRVLAYTGRGTLYYKQRNYDAALRDLDRALELDPRAVEARISRGDVYFRKSDNDTALAEYNRAIEIDRNAANAYNGRGDVYSNKSDYDAALREYNRAIELAPQEPRGYVGRGGVYRYPQRKYAEALQEMNRAIELDPNYAPAYRGRGLVYALQKNYTAALREYSRAIELDPNYAPAYHNRGGVYYDQEDYTAAIREYSRAIELDAYADYAYASRGWAYYFQDRNQDALRDFNRAIELDPNNASAYSGRGGIYRVQSDYAAALREYNRAIELDPNEPAWYNNRGANYQKQKLCDLAQRDYEQALRLDPNYETAQNNLRNLQQMRQRGECRN